MRTYFLLIATIPVLTCGAALAQTAASPPASPPAKGPPKVAVTAEKPDCTGNPSQIRACGELWVKQCMGDWDAGTHMTKQEYNRVCRRVANERVKFLLSRREGDAQNVK